MGLKTLKTVRGEFKYLKSVIKKYGDSLIPGKYVVFPNRRALSLNDVDSLSNSERYFNRNKSIGKLIYFVNFVNNINYFKNKNKKSSGSYEAVYTANNHDEVREVKLFSFKDKKILTICTDEGSYNAQISQYSDLGRGYNMPKVEPSNKYENSFEIDMVSLENRPGERYALENITQSGAKYFPLDNRVKRVSVKDTISFDYSQEINEILSGIVAKINPGILNDEFVWCTQHGDLSRDNLIYGESNGKRDFWWIDWEHVGSRLFFYDYFFYILNTAVYFKDLEAFNAYMSGECDADLKRFFEAYGMTFKEENRVDYFMIFAVSFLKERVCEDNRVGALKMYCNFIEKFFSDIGEQK